MELGVQLCVGHTCVLHAQPRLGGMRVCEHKHVCTTSLGKEG